MILIPLRFSVAAAVVVLASPSGGGPQQVEPVGKPSIAVLAFANGATGPAHDALDPLRIGIADLLVTEIAKDTAVRVLERERIANILKEQNLTASGAVDQATAARIGRLIGVRGMVFGTFVTSPGGRLKIVARRVSVATAEVEQVNTVEGEQE